MSDELGNSEEEKPVTSLSTRFKAAAALGIVVGGMGMNADAALADNGPDLNNDVGSGMTTTFEPENSGTTYQMPVETAAANAIPQDLLDQMDAATAHLDGNESDQNTLESGDEINLDEQSMPIDSIMHEQSGISISAYEDGSIVVSGYGTGTVGDPLANTSIFYDGENGEVSIQNLETVQLDGSSEPTNTTTTFPVEFQNTSDVSSPDSITGSTVDVPTAGADSPGETGIFENVQGESGSLEATIYDRGRLSEGAVSIQFTDSDTGDITKLDIDENTVSVTKIPSEGAPQRAIVEVGGAFAENDFRHQGPEISSPKGPGAGGPG